MPRIASWLQKPLTVLVTVALVSLGAGAAHAETTPPPSATATITEVIVPEKPPVKPEPPVVAKPQPPAQPSEWVDTDNLVKPIINAGVDTPATVAPMVGGSVFNTTATGIAVATLLLMLSVALVWRRLGWVEALFTRR